MTTKREPLALFGSPDEKMQVDYDSHTPPEGEVEEVQEPCSNTPRRMAGRVGHQIRSKNVVPRRVGHVAPNAGP